MNMPRLIILMSGRGKRFVESGYKQIKPLIEVDEKPMIHHVLDLFPGIQDVTFVCNERHLIETDLISKLDKICPHRKILSVPDQSEGPAKVLDLIENDIQDDEEIIVSYCDYGTVWDFKEFLNQARKMDGMISCYRGFHPHMLSSTNYAYCKLVDGFVTSIQEKKPFTNEPMNEYASNGTYYFKSGKILKNANRKLISSGKKINGEYYVSMIFNHMIEDNYNVGVFQIEKMLQWGTPYDLEVYKKWSNYFNKKWSKIETQSDTCLILPMAGHGSRFSEQGYKLPKPLLPIDDCPMIVKAVESLPTTKNQVFIALKSHVDVYGVDAAIKKVYPDAKIVPINKTTEGQACTCAIGINEIDKNQSILISACDNGVRYDQEKYQLLLKEDPDVIVWGFTNNPASRNNPDMYSWLQIDDNNNILSVSCKKFLGGNPLDQYAIIGTMYFKNLEFFKRGFEENYNKNIRTNNEFFVDDVISRCIEMKLKVKLFPVDDYICWGTPEDYKTYNYWKEHFIK